MWISSDDAPLALDLVGAKRRVTEHVGEDLQGHREVLVEDPRVEARVLPS
jgi:hypothetical protein